MESVGADLDRLRRRFPSAAGQSWRSTAIEVVVRRVFDDAPPRENGALGCHVASSPRDAINDASG
jgi:hypothetical protein